MDDSLSGGRIEFIGVGHYLLSNQNAATLYSGDELTHFNFVRPLLPGDFSIVSHEILTWKVLNGPSAGIAGVFTSTSFSPHGISAGAVPLPAAVWLLGSAFGALGLARRRAA